MSRLPWQRLPAPYYRYVYRAPRQYAHLPYANFLCSLFMLIICYIGLFFRP
jgi:hypothetical protein